MIGKYKVELAEHIPSLAPEIRVLPPSYVVFLLAVHTIETMRAARGLPSSLVWNFCNSGLNRHHQLGHLLEALSVKVRLPD